MALNYWPEYEAFQICKDPCDHRSCVSGREQWNHRDCRICGKDVEPGELFYTDYERDGRHIVHRFCLHD